MTVFEFLTLIFLALLIVAVFNVSISIDSLTVACNRIKKELENYP